MALHAAQRDRPALERTRKELIGTLRSASQLHAEIAAAKRGSPWEDHRELYRLYPHFSGLLPSLESLMQGDVNTVKLLSTLETISARSYFLVLAAQAKLRPMLNFFARNADGELDEEMIAASGFALSLAHTRALQVDDRSVALMSGTEIANTIRLVVQRLKDDGEVAQQRAMAVQADIIHGTAALDYGDIGTAEKMLASILKRTGKQWSAKDTDPPGASILSACASHQAEQAAELSYPSAPDDDSLDPRQQRMELERLMAAIADKRGRRVPLHLLDRALDNEAKEILVANRVEMSQRRNSVGALLEVRDRYAKWRSTQAQHVRKVAVAVGCLLSRPGVRDLVGLEFVNASTERRVALTNSVHALLTDQGRFSSASFPTTDSDFMLLQAVAILQANQGISASTARQVFKGTGERQAIRQLEAALNTQHGQGSNPFAAVSSLRHAGGSLLGIMEQDPEGFVNYSYLRNQTIGDLATIRKALKDKEAALLFSQFGNILVATVVKHDQARSHVIPISRDEVRAAIRKLRAGLNPRGRDDSPLPPPYPLDTAWALYSKVLKPLAPSLQGAEVVYVVPGEDFAGFPFGAMITSKPPKAEADDFSIYRRVHWLADRHAFVILPSIHSLTRIDGGPRQAAPPLGDDALLGIGQPLVSDTIVAQFGLQGIPNTTRLLELIRQPGDPEPLLNKEANNASIAHHMNGKGARPLRYLLINSHALTADQLIPRGIDEAAILLSPLPDEESKGADFLTSSKVIHLNTPVKLALLLACDTGSGASTSNVQPYSGLVQAFLFSGAQSVLASVLPVSNTSTEAFAIAVLKRLRTENMPISQAVRLAAIELRCADGADACSKGERKVWAHPAYWSLFTLVGSGR